MTYKRFLVKRTFYIGEIRREVTADSIVEFDGLLLKIGEVTYKAPKFEGAIRAGWVVPTDESALEVAKSPQGPNSAQRKMPVENVDSTMGAVMHKKMDLTGTASFSQKEAVDKEFGSNAEKKFFNADENTKVYMPKTEKVPEKASKKEVVAVEPVEKKKRGRPAKKASEQVAKAGCVEFGGAEELAQMNPGSFEVTKVAKSKVKTKKDKASKQKSILERVVVRDDMTEDEIKVLEEWNCLKHWAKKRDFIKSINSLLVLKYLYDREAPTLKKHLLTQMELLQA